MGFFNKVWSGLDFWDKRENQQQRDQFAQSDEEERKRKAQQAANASFRQPSAPIATKNVGFNSPTVPERNDPAIDLTKPLVKVGSQSAFTQKNPLLEMANNPQKLQEANDQSNKRAELEQMTQQNLEQARKDATQGESWFGRNLLNRKAIEERAQATARTRAAKQFQDKYGWNNDPVVQGFFGDLRTRQDAESARLNKNIQTLDKVDRVTKKVGNVASYIPVTGSVMNLGLAGTEKLAKATGNTGLASDVEDTRLQLDTGMTKEEFSKLDPATQQKLRNLQTFGLALSPLDFVGVGGLAKSGVVAAGKKGAVELFEKGAMEAATKQALKKAAIAEAKAAIVPFVTGTAASVGAQAYLGGTDNIDVLDAVKTGAVTAGASKILPFESKASINARNIVEDAPKIATLSKAVDEGVEVASGFKSPNITKKMQELSAEASDLEVPAYQRRPAKEALAKATEDLNNTRAEELGVGASPLDVPAYEHKNKMQEVIDQGQNELDDFIRQNPDATDADIQIAKQSIEAQVVSAIDELNNNRYGSTTPSIPDVTSPIALAKATDQAPTVSAGADVPIADFSKAINAPLQKVDSAASTLPKAQATVSDAAEQVAKGNLNEPVYAPIDARGNEVLQSDAQVAQALADKGMAPQRGDSQVAAQEGSMQEAAQRAAKTEVGLSGTAAPRTRSQITSRIDDASLREDLNTNVPMREKVSLQDAEMEAKNVLNNMTDEALVGRFMGEVNISDPQGFFTSLNAIRRLERIDAPEADVAIRNALDAMTNYASESGRGLRTTQVVFEDTPTTMKADYLINKIKKAGAEMDDASRAELLTRIQAADAAADQVRALEAEAQQLLDSGVINNASLSPEVQAKASQLSGAIQKADRAKELAQGDAWKFYQQQLPPSSLGKRVGDIGRTLMLSSPTGRVFDVVSTGIIIADDILTRGVSDAMGKVVNTIAGRGTVKDSGFNVRQFLSGGKEGFKDFVDSLRGRTRVESILDEANRNSRGNIQTGGSKARDLVRSFVELPTDATRGLKNDELYRQAMQEAAKLGLKGDAQSTYATLRASVPSETQLRTAEQAWHKANMLHDNAISRALNNVANSLDKKGGGWASPLIRNQIAPFTSWLGGNLHRTLTDKNVVWNVGSAVNNLRKGNLQGALDDIARFAVNSGEALAVGYMLTEAGVITTQDANGDSYDGVYFHVGDRYIPVAVAGTAAVPIILGNAAHQGMQDGSFETVINSAGSNIMKSAGVASVFGGDNTLQKSVSEATRENGSFTNAAAEYAGGTVRQYIPGVTADVNAVLDQTSLNPTGEAAQTRVTETNPETGREKTNVLATELNKTLNRIPFASQSLDRQEGVPAKDLLDRSLKGNRETPDMAEQRQTAESLADMEKRLKSERVPLKDADIQDAIDGGDYESAIKGLEYKLAKTQADPEATNRQIEKVKTEILEAQLQSEGVPITNDGIKARTESGDYENAILGYRYQLQKLGSKKDTPESEKQTVKDEITRLQVAQQGSYPPSVIKLYSETSQSEWRAMGDPESADYDPELYSILTKYDEELTKKGVSKSTKGGEKRKYNPSTGGGKSAKSRGYSTSIATQNFSGGGFTPQKEISANYGPPKSAIPTLQKVANNDTSKLKKISVRKGGMA